MDPNDNLILVNDAASMFRRPLPKNSPPYTLSVNKCNNKMVDEWKTELLDKVSFNGKLQAISVGPLWNLYVGGFEIPATLEANKMIFPDLEEKQIEHWRDFFENATIESMWSTGKTTVGRGWAVLMDHFRNHDYEIKYKKIYEGSDDPYDWYTRSQSKRSPFHHGQMDTPFWTSEEFENIRELVHVFLSFQSGPQGIPGI